jgi:flagellar hook-associated protein 3 FlgL
VNVRVSTSMLQRSVLSDINNATSRLSRAQDKLTTGKELTRPSDDPAAVSKALVMRESLRGTQQQQSNVKDAVSWADATETALSSMTDLVERARELTTSGGSDNANAANRTSMADEVDQLIAALKEDANTKFGGRYLLSGSATTTAPYGSGDGYLGNTGTIAREIGPGVSVGINTTADGILGGGQGAGDGKLLHVLRDISDHLRANDGAAVRADIGRLDTAGEAITAARAANGALTNRLEAAGTRLDSMELMAKKGLTDVEDVDLAKALIDYNSQSTAYQAALRAGANMVQTSLMDFLR